MKNATKGLFQALRHAGLLKLVVVAALSGGGCSSSVPAAATCKLHAECLSGECRADGTCAPVTNEAADAGTKPDNASSDSQGGTDSGTSAATDSAAVADSESQAFVCTPDHNNAIERDEVAFAVGVEANFRVAVSAAFDSAGLKKSDGTRVWDLNTKLSGDLDATIKTEPVVGRWFTDQFPKATYAARLTMSSDLLGVFRATDAQLQLLGVVSPSDGLFATRLTYEPAVVVMEFPLTPDASWSTEATVSGKAQGVGVLYNETFASEVDAHGALLTPFGNFPVLRVNTRLVRTVGLLKTDVRSHFFVAECYGTVATIRSEEGTKTPEFKTAAEIRRWAPTP